MTQEQIRAALSKKRKELERARAEFSERLYRRKDYNGAARAKAKADALEREIASLEDYLPKSLSELASTEELGRERVVDKIIITYLAADFYNDAVCELRESLQKLGLQGCSLFPLAKEIDKLTGKYAALACDPAFLGLGKAMVTNEKLIEELTDQCQRYIGETLDLRDD